MKRILMAATLPSTPSPDLDDRHRHRHVIGIDEEGRPVEISEHELHRMVTDVDDQHRDGMRDMADNVAELHQGEGRRVMAGSRRRFLQGAGLGGLVLSVGPALLPVSRLWSPAFAQESGDAGIAAFAESVELAAVQAYMAAAEGGKVTTPAVVEAATTFAGHHEEHAGAFGGAAGDAATGQPNPGLLDEVGGQLEGAAGENAVLEIAYSLENAAAATYLFALGALESTEALQLTASILPVESQHAVVLSTVLGKPTAEYVPSFETQDAAVKPDAFPIS